MPKSLHIQCEMYALWMEAGRKQVSKTLNMTKIEGQGRPLPKGSIYQDLSQMTAFQGKAFWAQEPRDTQAVKWGMCGVFEEQQQGHSGWNAVSKVGECGTQVYRRKDIWREHAGHTGDFGCSKDFGFYSGQWEM